MKRGLTSNLGRFHDVAPRPATQVIAAVKTKLSQQKVQTADERAGTEGISATD